MPGRLVVFWDYDTAWGADRSREPGGPKAWGHDEFVNTERLLELHAQFSVPACFAVVGSAALPGERPYHDPAQIRRIAAMGHEVGSHSFRHEWLPGLAPDALRETLRASREALEQCIGGRVRTFVPPFNQPFDYPRALSFSLSERREVRGHRNGFGDLCEALEESGYSIVRGAYRPLPQRIAERLAGHRLDRPLPARRIGALTCLRLNTPGGFGPDAIGILRRCAAEGGVVTAYGHPHSLHGIDYQNEQWLVPFLQEARKLIQDGSLQAALPKEIGGELA
jgi:peptidoglycan/xylan/chitin deacetylase (PgdA/CDA1 family)